MRRRERMAALLARREREGVSLQALSDETGIPVGTLSWWNWRLRHDAGPPAQSAGGFVELCEVPTPAQPGIVVRLGNGNAVEIPFGSDADWLRELVAALQSC